MVASIAVWPNNEKLREIDDSNALGVVKFFKKLPLLANNGVQFVKLYFMKPIDMEASRAVVRYVHSLS